jgi:hypothetical protein
MTRRARTVTVTLCSLAAIGILAACGPVGFGKRTTGGASPSKRAAAADPIARTNTLLAIDCVETLDGPDIVTVTGIIADTGAVVFRRPLSIPEPAGIGGPALACGEPQPTRKLFDRGLTRLAVLITDSSAKATRAGYLDIATGKVVDLGPKAGDAFAPAAKDASPIFALDDDRLWLTSGGHAYAVDPATGERREGQTVGSRQIVTLPGGRLLADDSVVNLIVNPSGTATVNPFTDAYTFVGAIGPTGQVTHPKQLPELAGAGQRLRDAGYQSLDPIRPAAWIDDRSLLATIGGRLRIISFSADFTAVTAISEPILPETDWKCRNFLVSPDRKTMMFRCERGTAETLFRASLTPGSRPETVADLTNAAWSGTLFAWL